MIAYCTVCHKPFDLCRGLHEYGKPELQRPGYCTVCNRRVGTVKDTTGVRYCDPCFDEERRFAAIARIKSL